MSSCNHALFTWFVSACISSLQGSLKSCYTKWLCSSSSEQAVVLKKEGTPHIFLGLHKNHHSCHGSHRSRASHALISVLDSFHCIVEVFLFLHSDWSSYDSMKYWTSCSEEHTFTIILGNKREWEGGVIKVHEMMLLLQEDCYFRKKEATSTVP